MTPAGFVNGLSAEEVSALRREFRNIHAIELKSFLATPLLRFIQGKMGSLNDRLDASRSLCMSLTLLGGPPLLGLAHTLGDKGLPEFVAEVCCEDGPPPREVH